MAPTRTELAAWNEHSRLAGIHWVFFLIAGLATFTAYCLRWTQAPIEVVDTPIYLTVLHGFSNGHISQTYDRTPGLPLFLLLAGTCRFYFYGTLFLYIVSVGGAAFLLSRLAVRGWVIWAFVLVALLPPYVQNAAYLSTESITSSFLTLGFVGLSLYVLDRRWQYCFLSALCFVWAGITRPTNLLTPFLLAVILLALPKRRLARAAALLVCVPTLLIGSFALHSAFQPQYFGISSMLGYQLSNSTVPLYVYIDNPIARDELVRARHDLSARGSALNYAVWKARANLRQRLGLSDPELGRFLLRMNLRLILHHPELYLEGIARTSNVYWFPYSTTVLGNKTIFTHFWYGIHVAIIATFFLELTVLMGLFIGSCIFNRDSDFSGDRSVLYLLAITIIYQTMVVSVAVIGLGDARYRSVTDLLIIFAVALITDWGITIWQVNHPNSRHEESLLSSDKADK